MSVAAKNLILASLVVLGVKYARAHTHTSACPLVQHKVKAAKKKKEEETSSRVSGKHSL